MGALQFARDNGVFTAGVTTNPQAAMARHCDVLIAPAVGPEVIAGSTRLKSGTAQKLVLNMISTGVMLRLGRIEGNLMADLRPLCGKLEDRARRLVMAMANVDSDAAENALTQTNGNVREAVSLLNSNR
jgi:N-acetylmuramic acid 6-phosphate etherase